MSGQCALFPLPNNCLLFSASGFSAWAFKSVIQSTLKSILNLHLIQLSHISLLPRSPSPSLSQIQLVFLFHWASFHNSYFPSHPPKPKKKNKRKTNKEENQIQQKRKGEAWWLAKYQVISLFHVSCTSYAWPSSFLFVLFFSQIFFYTIVRNSQI